jgi:hypothetical protein
MMKQRDRSRAKWLLAGGVVVAGVLHTLFLQSAIRDEVFINGDAGVKALVVRQFAAGGWHSDLRLAAEPWVEELWDAGLYPFGPPFVYRVEGRRYIQFPLTFPAITAPLYRLLGFRGLYVIPLVSIWILWVRFLLLGRRLRLGPLAAALSLAGLIFASPLTVYSAMFWEHTLAVTLACCGLAELLSEADGPARPWRSAVGGILLGLSVWFRPECACLALAAIAAPPCGRTLLRSRLTFVAALAVSGAALLALNYALYGVPLGLHSVQTVELDQLHSRREPALEIGATLAVWLVYFCPVVLLSAAIALAGLWWSWLKPSRVQAQLWIIASVFCASSLAILPATGGKQFGPRYWLPVVPVIWLIAALQIRQILSLPRRAQAVLGMVLLVGAIGFGGWVDTYTGTQYVFQDYARRILPALTFLRSRDESAVAVSHQWIAQELEATFDEKRFFRIKDEDQFMQLARRMRSVGERSFLWLRYRPIAGAVRQEPGLIVRRQYLGSYGSYLVFRCTIEGAARPR